MLKNKIAFFFLVFSSAVFSKTADSNFIFSYNNLDKFIGLCLTDSECDLDASQKDLLQAIASAIPEERKNTTQLVFVSAKERPGFFVLDGQIKVAKTYDDIGSSIYVNTDMIKGLEVVDAVAILIHELGHHHKIKDETVLDLLGLKVAFYYQQKYLQETYHELIPGLKVSAYNYWLKKTFTNVFDTNAHFDLVIADENRMEVLTDRLKSFNCSESIPDGSYCDNRPVLLSSNVQNLLWHDPQSLIGNVTFNCICSDNSLKNIFGIKRNFQISIILNDNTYQANSASIRILP